MITSPRVVCLVIDALSASYLGPYGNTWIHTPAFNQLAAQSLVLDRMHIETTSFHDAYASMWTGVAPWCAQSGKESRAIPTLCQAAGLQTALLTDEPDVASHPHAPAFNEVVQIPTTLRTEPTINSEETAMADVFSAILSWLQNHTTFDVLWLHTGAMRRVWDAPMQLREAYADEDDPRPAQTVAPPNRVITRDTDPDELLSLRHAYAGQVTVLDQCLESFLDTLNKLFPQDSLLFLVLGLRGYPLGEHGTVGSLDAPLFGELTHCPCCVRIPNGEMGSDGGVRSCALAQPRDLHTTICDWMNLTDPRDSSAKRTDAAPNRLVTTPLSSVYSLLRLLETSNKWPRLLSMAQSNLGEVALVTPAWYFRSLPLDSNRTPNAQIFTKPDDYFEANEVSARCHDEVAEFQEILRQIHTSEALDSLNIALSHRLAYGADAPSANGTGNAQDQTWIA